MLLKLRGPVRMECIESKETGIYGGKKKVKNVKKILSILKMMRW
jgi:hypothetical protein